MIVIKGICNRTCFGLSLRKQRIPAQTENNIRIIERIRWLESGSEKMSRQSNPFEYKGKRKPVYPEFFSNEAGCLFLLVEVAGIEPASGNLYVGASTCLDGF